MREISRALLAQRAALLPTAGFSVAPTFVDEVDLSLTDRPYPLVSLRVEPGPSSVRAVVPVKVYETVTVLADEASLNVLDEVSGKIFEGIQEKSFFGFDATIHRATWEGTKYPPGVGNERKSVTTWSVLASWRAR
jgi:hypothetical protein